MGRGAEEARRVGQSSILNLVKPVVIRARSRRARFCTTPNSMLQLLGLSWPSGKSALLSWSSTHGSMDAFEVVARHHFSCVFYRSLWVRTAKCYQGRLTSQPEHSHAAQERRSLAFPHVRHTQPLQMLVGSEFGASSVGSSGHRCSRRADGRIRVSTVRGAGGPWHAADMSTVLRARK